MPTPMVSSVGAGVTEAIDTCGAAIGVRARRGALARPVPVALAAVTSTYTVTPLVRPVTSQPATYVVVHVAMGEPPAASP